jgi:hypothetical protein
MTRAASSPREPLSESPWFWAYLFATAALVALFLAGPKYERRQPQLERQFSARQRAGQVVVGPDGAVPLSTRERLIISLRPMYVVLGVLLLAAWLGLWYQRYRSPHGRQPPPDV